MNEVKRPRKPLIYYYTIVLLVLLLFNFLAMPWLTQRQVQQVDYGTFLEMAENKELGQVEVQQQENQILFTNKENTAIYKTGMMPDPDLTQRLADSGAQFSGELPADLGAADRHLHRHRAVHVEKADAARRRPQLYGLRHGRREGPRPVQAGEGEGPLHRLYR